MPERTARFSTLRGWGHHEGETCPQCGGSGIYIARADQTTGIDCFRCKGSGRVGIEDHTCGLWDDREEQARMAREETLHLAGLAGMDKARAQDASDRELGYYYCA